MTHGRMGCAGQLTKTARCHSKIPSILDNGQWTSYHMLALRTIKVLISLQKQKEQKKVHIFYEQMMFHIFFEQMKFHIFYEQVYLVSYFL